MQIICCFSWSFQLSKQVQKLKICIHLLIYLVTLSVAQIMWCQIIGQLVNNEIMRIWKESCPNFWYNIVIFLGEKPQKTSVRIPGFWAETWAQAFHIWHRNSTHLTTTFGTFKTDHTNSSLPTFSKNSYSHIFWLNITSEAGTAPPNNLFMLC